MSHENSQSINFEDSLISEAFRIKRPESNLSL
jgi:hypothetical protein